MKLTILLLASCASAPRPAPLPSAAVTLRYRRTAPAEQPVLAPCPLAWTSSLNVGCALASGVRR